MQISQILKERYSKPVEHKIEYSYQDLGIQLEEYFNNKRVWTMFHKVGYTEHLMRYAWKECARRNIKAINYFETIIRNKITVNTTEK